MRIRKATPEDAEAISALIRSVAHYFTLEPSGKGAERFLESITPKVIAGYISNAEIHYLAAIEGGELAGVAALRSGTHLLHLFVAPAHQGQGVSRSLYQALMTDIEPGTQITVNSSPNAVPVYERFGFEKTGPKVETNGIAFVPMKAVIAEADQRQRPLSGDGR